MAEYFKPDALVDILNIIRILSYTIICIIFFYKFLCLLKHRYIFLLLGIIYANAIFLSLSVYHNSQYVDLFRNLQTLWAFSLAIGLVLSLGRGEVRRHLRGDIYSKNNIT